MHCHAETMDCHDDHMTCCALYAPKSVRCVPDPFLHLRVGSGNETKHLLFETLGPPLITVDNDIDKLHTTEVN